MSLLEQRLKEAKRLGMDEAIVPAGGSLPEGVSGIKIVRVRSLAEAISWLMDKK